MTPENKDVAGLLPSSEGVVADAIHDLRELHAQTTTGVWGKGLTTHHMVSRCDGRLPYRIAEFHHARDAAFCDAAHALVPMLLDALAAPGAAIAAREQEAASDMAQSDLEYALAALHAIAGNDEVVGGCIEKIGDIRRARSRAAEAHRRLARSEKVWATALASRQEAPVASGEYQTNGYALAMRVLQSDLYPTLDDRERADCDALIAAGQQPTSPSGAGLGGAVASSEAVPIDMVLVPRDLIGAACFAIESKRPAEKTVAELRRYTFGDLKQGGKS